MENYGSLRGLVLSGGESRRMGRDKGLISTEATSWVNRAGTLLHKVGLPVNISIREDQRSAYIAAILPDFELLSDLDLPMGGPLKGLLSFHQRYPHQDVLVLPCDMPKLTTELLRDLAGFYKNQPHSEAWIFKINEVAQPFPGIYSARLLADTFAKVGSGSLSRHGLVHLLRAAKTVMKVAKDETAFRNFNSPADF